MDYRIEIAPPSPYRITLSPSAGSGNAAPHVDFESLESLHEYVTSHLGFTSEDISRVEDQFAKEPPEPFSEVIDLDDAAAEQFYRDFETRRQP